MKDFFNSFYPLFIFLWFLSGILFVLRTFRKAGLKKICEKVQYVTYGIGSSMLIGWAVCEICLQSGLSIGLSGSLGGVASFLGANTIAELALQYFKNKVGIKENKEIREVK